MSRIIIIDDEIDIIDTLSEFFEDESIEIIGTGKNGQEAVELCIKHSPDFLLLDISMPKFDGFYALEKLKELNSQVKIILMTGLIGEDTESKLSEYKLATSFLKPVQLKELLDFIKNN